MDAIWYTLKQKISYINHQFQLSLPAVFASATHSDVTSGRRLDMQFLR